MSVTTTMKLEHRQNERGFTLIELMIVVVIIGILAAMAIPKFIAVATKSKQSEAKLVLKQIHNNEQTYFQQNQTYWIPPGGQVAYAGDPTAFAEIWVDIQLPARYTYTITGTSTTFLATATSGILDDDPTEDQWTIDHLGDLKVVPGKDDAAD